MTIMCVATDGSVPGVWPCRIRGQHTVTCLTPDDCAGCRPRPAERGFLCARHYDDVEHALAKWTEFASRVKQVGDRAVRRDREGSASASAGYVPLPSWMVDVDECRSYLRSQQSRPLHIWASTETGARDAIMFARAADRAYRAHETAERAHRIHRTRCPFCGSQLIWQPPVAFTSDVTVACMNDACGRVLDQAAFEVIAAIETTRKARP